MNPIDWLLRILTEILKLISPDLREAIKKLVLDLEEKAKLTPNPWDDLFVWALKKILAID